MEYRNGELLYVCKKDKNWQSGLYVLYRDKYKGNEDLSYHGSPWYENFIVCEYLNSHDRVDFGDQTWCWRSVNEYIKNMQNKLREIKNIADI